MQIGPLEPGKLQLHHYFLSPWILLGKGRSPIMSVAPRGHTLTLVYMVQQNVYWLLWQFLPQVHKHLSPVFSADTLSSRCHLSCDLRSLIGSQKAVNVLSVQLLSCCNNGSHQMWFYDYRSGTCSIIVSHVKANKPPFWISMYSPFRSVLTASSHQLLNKPWVANSCQQVPGSTHIPSAYFGRQFGNFLKS